MECAVCLRVVGVSCKCCRVSVKNASHASLFLLKERHLSEHLSVLQSEVHLVQYHRELQIVGRLTVKQFVFISYRVWTLGRIRNGFIWKTENRAGKQVLQLLLAETISLSMQENYMFHISKCTANAQKYCFRFTSYMHRLLRHILCCVLRQV